ncbi:PHP domain-containing protein [Paenibacillus sp. GCM10027627]|uniref:PHP domain-containing protein n=1 Tax=unclassified Paenibacillus TaxID=185978 RepID=UPI0036347F9D
MALTAIGKADLHTHTTASDGNHSPAEVVQMAKKAGLAAIAITDHDTTAGLSEALQEGRQIGISVVPGVELSTVADRLDIHILAYFADHDNVRWLERLQSLGRAREGRNEMIVSKLQELGVAITMDHVLQAASVSGDTDKRNKSVGRPHIAAALVSLGAAENINEAFSRYLGSGAAAHVQVPRIHPLEAIEWIREAGGMSVIAHPGLYGNDTLVEQLIRGGANGIEIYHSDHGPEEARRYGKLAERYSVIGTGGSDFHGERQGGSYHGDVGSVTVDISVVRRLQAGAVRQYL